jgi:hypothetical protein
VTGGTGQYLQENDGGPGIILLNGKGPIVGVDFDIERMKFRIFVDDPSMCSDDEFVSSHEEVKARVAQLICKADQSTKSN